MTKHPLGRLLRLRSLLEDVSRVELETAQLALRRVEKNLEDLSETQRRNRQRGFEALTGNATDAWLETAAIQEMAAWQSQAMLPIREERGRLTEDARTQYFERRKDYRQLESILHDHASHAAVIANRREQREMDDWFHQQAMRRSQSGNTAKRPR